MYHPEPTKSFAVRTRFTQKFAVRPSPCRMLVYRPVPARSFAIRAKSMVRSSSYRMPVAFLGISARILAVGPKSAGTPAIHRMMSARRSTPWKKGRCEGRPTSCRPMPAMRHEASSHLRRCPASVGTNSTQDGQHSQRALAQHRQACDAKG